MPNSPDLHAAKTKGFDDLQQAIGREGMEPPARAVRKSSGLNFY
ncbi:hypothetical protein SBA3_660009 [Candidatus Sulfopaludibacter sp. SbA3]|nr:hypothetical protein SBA3_660009 [Candidatus Sulfopaludibacter sp. SbA3]